MKNRLTLGLLFVLSMSFWLFMPGLPLAQNKDTSHQVRKNPDAAANNYYLKTATGYFTAQDYAKAAEAAELAILLDPGCAEAQALLQESQRLQKRGKQTGGTQAPKTSAVQSPPGDGISPVLLDAHGAIQESRYDEAHALLDSILQKDPSNKEALVLKGMANDLSSKEALLQKGAANDLKHGLDTDGTLVPKESAAPSSPRNDISSLLEDARIAIREARYGDAQTLLDSILKTDPRNKNALHLKAVDAHIALREARYDDAQAILDSILKTDPRNKKALYLKAVDAHIAIQEARYDDAQAILDSILKTDPFNKRALYLKGAMNDIKHGWVTESLKTTSAQEKQGSDEHLRESIIPYKDILRFPAEVQWKDIANRKLPELDKIVEENKKTTDKLRLIPNPAKDSSSKIIEDALNTIISFEFIDTPLKDVVAFVREKTNTNMIIDHEAGGAQITLKLNGVPLKTAFRYLLPKGYEYVIEGDIFHIYRQKMELRVYDVRDILINLDDKEPLKFDIAASATLNIEKAKVVKGKDTSERIVDLIEQIVTTIEPLSWSDHVGVIGTTDAVEQRRIRVAGQGEGSVVARTGQPGDLVIVNSKYVHKQIETLLAALRSSQNLQVSIEVRFITVTDKFMEDIGSNITELFSKKTSLDTGAAGITGGLSVNYSILNNTMVEGLIRAIQESKGSEILTSPRITLSNTQRGNIAVVRMLSYIKGATASAGGALPEIAVVPEGTTFDVRPIVSADRKYVYLEVTPSVYDLKEPIEVQPIEIVSIIPSGGLGDDTPAITKLDIKLPEVTLSQVSVTVSVPDKGTLLIGGLGSINKDNLTTGIPILSKIPILKTLFSRNQKNNEKRTMLILLKPTIIIREEQEERFFGQSNNKSAATNLPNGAEASQQR